jgi:hypothetical protein
MGLQQYSRVQSNIYQKAAALFTVDFHGKQVYVLLMCVTEAATVMLLLLHVGQK